MRFNEDMVVLAAELKVIDGTKLFILMGADMMAPIVVDD